MNRIPAFLIALPIASAVAVSAPVEIDREASRIAAHVRATGHSFDAVVRDYELVILWDRENRTISSAEFRFDFADVETGRGKRDREMREWLDYEAYPVAEFVLDALEPAVEGVESGVEGVEARGRLTMHGVDREIVIPLTIDRENGSFRISGRMPLDHRDWDLDRIRAFIFMTVDPVLDVTFDIRGTETQAAETGTAPAGEG